MTQYSQGNRIRAGFGLGCVLMVLSLLACPNPASSSSNSNSPIAYLYVTNSGNPPASGLSAFTLSSSGALSPLTGAGGSLTTGASPDTGVVVSGNYLYVTNDNGTSISLLTVGSGGLLSSTNVYPTGKYPYDCVISPNGNYLYDVSTNGIDGFSIGTGGALTSVPSSPFPTDLAPAEDAITPDGNYLYVTCSGANDDVAAFSIGTGGTLSYINGTLAKSVYASNAGPMGIAISPDGNYLYVANFGSGTGTTVTAFSIGAGGALSYINGTLAKSSFTAGTGPLEIAISPNGNYLYVTNEGSDNISAYSIGSGGNLSPIEAV